MVSFFDFLLEYWQFVLAFLFLGAFLDPIVKGIREKEKLKKMDAMQEALDKLTKNKD